jgi:hypothetical protein
MAKKQISNYKFFPGVVPPAYNQFPDTVALLEANKDYIISEATEYLAWSTNTPSYPAEYANSAENTATILLANKEFIKEEANAWVLSQIASSTAPFVGYSYNTTKQIKCKRDIGYLIDAFYVDLLGGGNAETIRISRMFYLNGDAQLLNPVQEAAVHAFVKNLMVNFVLPQNSFITTQSPVIADQDAAVGVNAETLGITKIGNLNDIVIDLITDGLGSLPAISYNYNQIFAELVYGATKCRRDIAYILDAVAFDIALQTNYNATFVGLAESNSLDYSQTVIDVINASKTEVLALSAVSASGTATSRVNSDYTQILALAGGGAGSAVSFTDPSTQTASLIAVKDNLVANKEFIQAEINAWVGLNYPDHNHDEAKCARDVGFAIDGFCYDMLYGGNSATYEQSRFFYYSGASGISDEHKIQTVQAYGRLKTIIGDIVQNISISKTTTGTTPNVLNQYTLGTAADSADALILEDLAQIVIDVVDTGIAALPVSKDYPQFTGDDPALEAAWTAILNAITAIQDAVVTYSDYTYDEAKCIRDTTYVVDSYIHDLTYGGNSLTHYVASRYYIAGVVQVNQPQVEVITQTFVKDLITEYIALNKYHPSYQLVDEQTVLTDNAELAGVSQFETLADYVIDTIDTGTNNLPEPIAPDSQDGTLLSNAVALLESNKRYIQEEAIAYIQYNIDNNIAPFIYYTYNAAKCRRDVSYVLEGYISDLKHGGNGQTLFNASKYWENGVAQVDGDRLPEIYTHTFIRDLIENNIWANVAYTSKQILASQVIDTINAPEIFANTRIKELSNTILDVIEKGVDYLPVKVSNRGYVKLPGFFKLKDFLLITNASRNTIMYNFADDQSAAEVTYSENFDSDFPGALFGNDKITTITFDVDTSRMMVTDNIQIFVEGKAQEVRLNSIATDAMERMKVGIPQSMLDADFEYGLQPTKWQAIALMRNYPSIYEIPGSDIAVTNVVTDASAGTSGTGASKITVTTQNSHGLVIGDPITIKALANTISGFSRAEGSFLVAGVDSLTTFFYYGKSKVGTSNGQILASTYTQLRKGGFYTGSAIGNPTFSVFSAGSSGSITTELITQSGRDTIGFTGSPPPIGSPISGTGVNSGTQVTAVTGSGGIVASTTLITKALVGATSIVVTDTTGISAGLVFDRGDGVAVSITDVTGNTVSLGGALTSEIVGTSENYLTLTQDSTTGTGVGAVFTVSRSGGTYSTTVTNNGSGYKAGDTVSILGTSVGGATTANDATITIESATALTPVTALDNASLVGGTGYINVNVIGVATLGKNVTALDDATLVTGSLYVDATGVPTTSSGVGTGLTVDIVTDGLGGVTSVTINQSGFGYVAGDIITIAQVGSGTDATIEVLTARTGTGLTVDITTDGNAVTAVTINTPGQNYAVGGTLKILDGNSDATIQVLTVGTGGGVIQTVSTSGTPITAPTEDFYSAFTISEVTTSQLADGNTDLTYSAISTIQISFTSPHGFIPGDTVTIQISSTGTNAQLAAGPFFVEQVPTPTTIRYTARAAGAVDNTLVGVVYGRPDSFFVHRPFDGGVQLGTASPSHGASAIRMSKKYIRYQSGKGVMYNTGALFAPSYDIRSMTASGTAIGSVITIVTDDTDHGCQVGGGITISGVTTSGYNGNYTVTDIANERQFSVIASKPLGATTAVLGSPCQMSIRTWHGSTIRAGIFDDQNGMFWQYDGIRMAVVRRSSTFQLAGTIAINANSNTVTGSNTRFTSQLAAGDRIVIRGMSHIISQIDSDTTMYVTPDYRGVNNLTEAKVAKTIDIQIPQENWNLDTLNGAGPSGYVIDVTKMQMIGLQHTWYGAGFIDFMLRGPEGNYTFAHRFRNSNVNSEAYMRTGNQPVRYEVINEGARDKLSAEINATATTIPLTNAYWFPTAGTVIIDSELIRFTGNTGTALTGCVRGTSLTQFTAGSQRNFTGSVAASHVVNSGVILVSNTITPNISHWGSAFMIDGQFDSDRGYIFNYASTAISVSVDKVTAFLIRLAPSVSNAQVGDLGDKELLNRAQLLLSSISLTSDTVSGGGAIVVEGVLNPQNYPTDPTKITWTGLASSAAGGQPSFAQIAAGGSVTWSGGASTSTATIQGAFTTTLTAKSFNVITASLTATSFSTVTQNVTARSFAPATSSTYTNALSTGRTDFLILQSDLTTLNASTTVQAGDTLTVLGNGTTISGLTINDFAGSVSFTSPGVTLYIGETITITGTISNSAFTLSNVNITGTTGQFSCNNTGGGASTLRVGQAVRISGTFSIGGGTGVINGYTDPTTYRISATNGTTTFTLVTSAGAALTTTAGNTNFVTVQVQAPSITGYTSGTQYRISATNGSTTATLTTTAGAAITTTGGSPTGLTFTINSFISSTTISSITQNYVSLGGSPYARIVMAAAPQLSSNTAASDGQYNVTVRISSSLTTTYSTAISNARNDFLIPQTQYASTTIDAADVLSVATFLTGGQTVTSKTASYCVISGTTYARIIMTANGNATSTAGSGNNATVTIANSVTNTYNRALSTARLDFLITDTEYNAGLTGIAASDVLNSTTIINGGQTVQSITPSYVTISGTPYTRIVMSAAANSNSTANAGNDVTVTLTAAGTAASYATKNFLFFTSASWVASGATVGTKLATSVTTFPAGTSVAQTTTRTFGATTIYRVVFTQTSTGTNNAAGTITFQFGAQYALPGEQVFSFISNPGESNELSLEALKELTATAIGGRGTFPNGPDVLAINVYKVAGTATPANLILRWGEAQA